MNCTVGFGSCFYLRRSRQVYGSLTFPALDTWLQLSLPPPPNLAGEVVTLANLIAPPPPDLAGEVETLVHLRAPPPPKNYLSFEVVLAVVLAIVLAIVLVIYTLGKYKIILHC